MFGSSISVKSCKVEFGVITAFPQHEDDLSGYGCSVLFFVDDLVCNVCQSVPCNIYEFEALLHCFWHSVWEAVELLANVFFEGVSSPTAHFWICISENPFKARAHAPPIRNECVSILLIGIPRYSGYCNDVVALSKAALMSSAMTLYALLSIQ